METVQSSGSANDLALISVRLISMDYYLTSPSPSPTNNFDPIYSVFRSSPIHKVPILRVFGTTPAGQKTCLHVHGIFPYLYIPLPAGDHPGFLYRLAASLDKALNMMKSGTGFEQQQNRSYSYDNPSHHHVFKVTEVSGTPYYGYHAKEHRFAKVYLYNPYDLRKASDILASGSVMGQVLQPHYGHVPYTLQFMMDYNLQGMSLIHLRTAKFRHAEPIVMYQSQPENWAGRETDPSQKTFHIKDMPQDMLGPDDLPPMTTCEVELDAVAADILNSNDDLSGTLGGESCKKSGNPGLNLIWEDEKMRRMMRGVDLSQNRLTPPSTPPRQRSPNAMTESEQYWTEQFRDALEALQGSMDETAPSTNEDQDATSNFDPSAKVIVYPDETADNSMLQAATFVEDHLQSLSLGTRPEELEDVLSEKTDYFDDTIVDEAAISHFIDQEVLNQDQSVILDSDDDELVELLHELKESSNKKDSSIITPSQPISNSSSQSITLSQLSQASRERFARDEAESLEMSQIVWDKEDLFDNEDEEELNTDFADDTFWESYDFESALE